MDLCKTTSQMPEQAVKKTTLDYLCRAKTLFRQDFVLSEIRFDLTGTTAGYFKQSADGRTIINYNREILRHNMDDFLARTIPHEVAHMVAYQVFGWKIRPHGKQWKSVMEAFQADASRCHNYDIQHLETRQYKRFLYYCDCQTHQLTSIRHNRVLAGQKYICKKCHRPLALQDNL